MVQWLILRLLIERVQVRSLVWELGSHMPHGQKNQNIKQEQYCNGFNKDFQKKKKGGGGPAVSCDCHVLKQFNDSCLMFRMKINYIRNID